MDVNIGGTWFDEYTASDVIRECGTCLDTWEDDAPSGDVLHYERFLVGAETWLLCWVFTKDVYEAVKQAHPLDWAENLPYDNGTCHVVVG